MKRAWDPSVLTVLWWRGPEPSIGDVLETSTGRRYLIQRMRYGRAKNGRLGALRAFETVVLPAGEPLGRGTKVFSWEWGRRQRSDRRRRVFLGMAGSRARA